MKNQKGYYNFGSPILIDKIERRIKNTTVSLKFEFPASTIMSSFEQPGNSFSMKSSTDWPDLTSKIIIRGRASEFKKSSMVYVAVRLDSFWLKKNYIIWEAR